MHVLAFYYMYMYMYMYAYVITGFNEHGVCD